MITARTTGFTPVSRTAQRKSFSLKLIVVGNKEIKTATGRPINIKIIETPNSSKAVSARSVSETIDEVGDHSHHDGEKNDRNKTCPS